MKNKVLRLFVVLVANACLSGCTLPLLQNFPFLSRFSAVKPEVKASTPATLQKPAEVTPVASPTALAVLINPAPPVPSKPHENLALPPIEAVAPKLPAASVPLPAKKASPPRTRYVFETSPDISYEEVLLTEDTVWSGRVHVKKGITVAPQATLTVEPGTTVRFGANAVLLIQGRISMNGTPDRPILLTSEFVQAEPGDWQGVLLLGTEKNNVAEECIVEGADTGFGAGFSRIKLKNCTMRACKTGAAFDDSLVTIDTGGFRKSATGMASRESEVDIRNADFSANGQGFIAAASSVSLDGCSILGNETEGIFIEKSRVAIRGNTLTGNGTGAVFIASEGVVAANRIVNNVGSGIRAEDSRLRVNANDISGNGSIGLSVTEGRVMAWENIIADNGEFDAYNAGKSELTVIGNWWGERSDTDIAARIYGRHRDSVAGSVRFIPVLRVRPPLRP